MDERMGLLPPPGTPPESAGRGGVADLDGMAVAARNHSNKDTVTSAHNRRKKWSEEEEESLISKYGELVRLGTLHRLKTREKKFEPIAAYVNSLHHSQDKVSFPWEWTWRDLSVKIQNMRHQYLGVKQKIRRPADPNRGAGDQDEYDWNEGIVHWSNFLKYKEVFGDLELEPNEILPRGSPGATTNNGKFEGKGQRVRNRVSNGKSKMRLFNNGNSSRLGAESGGVGGIVEKAATGDDGAPVVSLEGDDWGEDEEDDARNDHDNFEGSKRKKRKGNQGKVMGENGGGGCLLSERKLLAFLGAYIADQREREAQREAREREKEREREDKEKEREDAERERERNRLERERIREDQQRRLEQEREERERAREMADRERLEDERHRERAWEEKREKEKQEWIERMTALQLEHQASMMQMQAQMVQSQQNMVSLLLGFFLHGSQVGDNSGQRNSSISPLAAQILRNLQQLSAATGQGAERKAGIENATHFIVDGEVCVAATD